MKQDPLSDIDRLGLRGWPCDDGLSVFRRGVGAARQPELNDVGAASEFSASQLAASPQRIHQRLNASPRLIAHHLLVSDCAVRLLEQITDRFPNTGEHWDTSAVLFGAATHDIGKSVVVEELSLPGKKHEVIGEELLLRFVPADLARFASTHGRPVDDTCLTITDLLVILADKLWKGKRSEVLEVRIGEELSVALERDRWQLLVPLWEIFDHVAEGAGARLDWQAQWATE